MAKVGWLVVLRFNVTLTAKVISWQSVMLMCFLAFSHQYYHKFLSKFLTCFSRGERRKYPRKKFRLNRVLNSQPPGYKSDTLTDTEPTARGLAKRGLM